jgi:hypothetical protein
MKTTINDFRAARALPGMTRPQRRLALIIAAELHQLATKQRDKGVGGKTRCQARRVRDRILDRLERGQRMLYIRLDT